jgi:zinc finger protein 830
MGGDEATTGSTAGEEEAVPAKDLTLTPPLLNRRSSTTPLQGVEIQIPSRPATPATLRDSASSSATPNTAPLPISDGQSRTNALGISTAPTAAAAAQVDEDEWAAFEADIATATTAAAPTYAEDAVISAPAMSAAEVAAAKASTEAQAVVELALEDEREEATRALEEEFEEMEELEARVKRLKERREKLRQQGADAPVAVQKGEKGDKENLEGARVNGEDEDDEMEEDDDDDDGWDTFRFRTAV